jgi:hypothetical protein
VGNSDLWTPTRRINSSSSSRPSSIKTMMDMVAGGAERSQGDDYYEGALVCWSILTFMFLTTVSQDTI